MKRILGWAASLGLALAVGLGVVACGPATGGSGDTASVTPVTCASPTVGPAAARPSQSDSAKVQTQHSAERSQRVVPVTTLPPGVTFGQVRIEVEGTQFGPCDTIALWAGNGLQSTIYTTDHHSDCTIITLQRQVSGVWQPVATCATATATHSVPVTSMQAAFVQLKPGAGGVEGGAWPSGTYRATFSYSLASDGTGQPTEVDSPTFTIGAASSGS